MMQLQFKTIAECDVAGLKWKKVFDHFWPSYNTWLQENNFDHISSIEESQVALETYMPKMVPTYKHLCELVEADELTAKFLTGYQPPPYYSACAQAVTFNNEAQLIRNYDYSAALLEGVYFLSNWNGKKVMGTGESLVGLVDGMNEDGLAVSLTFGGRKEVGSGFAISFILRYILEFCSNVEEAVKELIRIPSHMSYNITLVDKSGNYKTVFVAPDKLAVVTDDTFCTNHQQEIDWEENAIFNKTRERYNFLENLLKLKGLTNERVASLFLSPPLYNNKFKEGFGTLFTALYRPSSGISRLMWRNKTVELRFDNFIEQEILINYYQADLSTSVLLKQGNAYLEHTTDFANTDWHLNVSEIIVNTLIKKGIEISKEEQEKIRFEIRLLEDISWDGLAEYYSKVGLKDWIK